MPDGTEDKSPMHPAMVNSDKHVNNLQKSVAKKRMTRLDSIENASAQAVARLKANQMKSRNAPDTGKREKGYN